MSQRLGLAAEEKARHYLQSQGLQWIASNYHCRCGEIDLIMRDNAYLVFVEVRARVSARFGGAMASITPSKKMKIIKAAQWYLLENRLYESQAIRFDVVALEGAHAAITWITAAFSVDFS